jgi:hypothetical protein
VSPSSRIELAAGTITPSGDTLQIELIPPCRQPAGSVDHLASRTKRHQHQPESDCERSDRGSPGLWRGAGRLAKL